MNKTTQFLIIALLITCNTIIALAQTKLGDTLTISGAKYKLQSENLIPNPGFENGFGDWTDATSSAAVLNATNFTIVATGGIDNSKYLVGTKNEGSSSAASIGTGWSIGAGKKYYFSYQVKYIDAATIAGTEDWCKISLTNDKKASTEPLILINASQVDGGGKWTQNAIVFTNSNPSYSFIVARFRWLSNRLGFDNFALHEVVEIANTSDLQTTIDEALSIYIPDTEGATELQTAITKAQGFLNSESSTAVLNAISELKAAIITYKLSSATPQNPLDMSHLIINKGFDNNTSDGWKGIGVINYHVVEFYQKTFNMSQKIVGLPTGKYVLKAQGFERPKANDGGSAYRAGTEIISASFYAKTNSFAEQNSPFSSLYKQSYSGTGSSNNYVNTMAAAETLFSNANKYYEVTVKDILLKQGDTLTIGAKNDFQQSGYWALFDNFRLEYHGSYEADNLKTALQQQITIAQSLITKKIQNSVRIELNTAITQAQEAIGIQPLVFENLSSANNLINSAINAGQASQDSYSRLQSLIDEAILASNTLSATKVQKLSPVLTLAQSVVNDLDVTNIALSKSITDISNIIYKKIYVPTWMMGNVNLESNNWSLSRSKQSKNWIIFWEPGYGEDPSVLTDGNFRINVDELLKLADQFYDFYTDSLKFTMRGSSKSDDYKMIIRLRYTRDWEATGSGVDNTIGLLTLTAWSAQSAGHTLAHEVGHCFQYQTHCDNNDQNGWMYGFGANASGGNGWWEQCAQWQGFKIYPTLQFTDGRFVNYLNTSHKHILHEAPRYDNYFIQDYWTFRNGMDFIGRMWNESKSPEDPVETYKRITKINQSQFNDEMYDHAARFTTWDIPALRPLGESKINSRPQTKMNNIGNNYWMVDVSVCPENYGYNVIKLNTPTKATTVQAFFEGKAGADGYRKNYSTAAGWRYGFVALLTNGTRVYSEMRAASYATPTDTLSFEYPSSCKQLWLVVSGAPSVHWRHAWDDDDSNDEQWPYQVKFNNTNLSGYQNVVNSINIKNKNNIFVHSSENILHIQQLPINAKVKIYDITGNCLVSLNAEEASFAKEFPKGIYIVKVCDSENNFNQKIIIP